MAFSKLSALLDGRYSPDGDPSGDGHPYNPDQPRVPAGPSLRIDQRLGRLDARLGRTPDSPKMPGNIRVPSDPSALRVSAAGSIGKTAPSDSTSTFHPTEYESRRVRPNEAFFVLQHIQDQDENREHDRKNFFRGSKATTGILAHPATEKHPATTIRRDNGLVTVRDGGVVLLDNDGQAFFFAVTNDDSIIIDTGTGIATFNR